MVTCKTIIQTATFRKFLSQWNRGHSLSTYATFSTRTCAYQGVRDVSFSENFAYVLNGWPLSISNF